MTAEKTKFSLFEWASMQGLTGEEIEEEIARSMISMALTTMEERQDFSPLTWETMYKNKQVNIEVYFVEDYEKQQIN